MTAMFFVPGKTYFSLPEKISPWVKKIGIEDVQE